MVAFVVGLTDAEGARFGLEVFIHRVDEPIHKGQVAKERGYLISIPYWEFSCFVAGSDLDNVNFPRLIEQHASRDHAQIVGDGIAQHVKGQK